MTEHDTRTVLAMERVAAYLDGRLSLEQTARLEAELAQGGEVARLLSEELMLRELLSSMPPDAPPEGLIERIEAACPGGPRSDGREGRAQTREPGRLSKLFRPAGLALSGVSWTLRGPALAVGPASAGGSSGRATLEGLATARFALGPLNAERERRQRPPKPKKPLWRRALKLVK